MKKMLIGIAVQLASFVLAGCGGVTVSPDKLVSINSFTVSTEVKIAEKPIYYGPENTIAGELGGALGVLIAQGLITAPDEIKAYLAEENIDVGQIFRTEFLQELKTDPNFAGKVSDTGSAHFELEVFNYGLFQNGPFSSEYKTVLYVRAKLIDVAGNILWQDKDFVSFHNDAIPAAPYKAFFDDPSTFRTGFTVASHEVTQLLIKNLDTP